MLFKKAAKPKAIISIIIVVCLSCGCALLSGCSNNQSVEEISTRASSEGYAVNVLTNKELKFSEEEILKAAEEALETEAKANLSDYSLVNIYYSEEESAYVVDFCIDDNTFGGDAAIYLSDKDLSFISYRFGE